MDTDDLILEGEELAQEGPLIEEGAGRVHVPEKGSIFADDGTVQVAVIRPCMSRGKKIKGFSPIYEADMLGRNARVFESWHMWMGHLTEGLREALDELQHKVEEAALNRNIARDLGGRVLETWFDPTYVGKDDDSLGYRPGAIMGKVIPYPAAKAILECDPQGLHVSIAAWPTAARKAPASWDKSKVGMAIEGFRAVPRGSVDWVLRGGAGGRLDERKLTEDEALAVTSLESLYASPQIRTPTEEHMSDFDFKNATQEQLMEHLREENPELAEAFKPAAKPDPAPADGALTAEAVAKIVRTEVSGVEERLNAKIDGMETAAEDKAQEMLQEREAVKGMEKIAHGLIKAAGLPSKATEDLLARYRVLPSGPTQALLVEAEGDKDEEQVLRESVEADITYVRELLEEVQSGPRVRGQGAVQQSSAGAPKRKNKFREFIREGADEVKDEDLTKLVQEGI